MHADSLHSDSDPRAVEVIGHDVKGALHSQWLETEVTLRLRRVELLTRLREKEEDRE